MVSLKQFSSVIETARRPDAAAKGIYFDPDRFYLENIRSYFRISREEAAQVLEEAVREGLVACSLGLLGRYGSILAVFRDESEVPEILALPPDPWGEDEESESPKIATALLGRIRIYSTFGKVTHGDP